MVESRYAECARIFKALCDENRARILARLKGGETCACALLECLDIAQSTLSHHMRILCESGLVKARQEGKWTHYSLSKSGCARAARLLGMMTTPAKATTAAGAAAGASANACGAASSCR